MSECLCLCLIVLCLPCICSDLRSQKKTSESLELDFKLLLVEVVVSSLYTSDERVRLPGQGDAETYVGCKKSSFGLKSTWLSLLAV